MRDIFKQLIFLWTILFINFLYADGIDTQITITDASGVYEYDDHLSFTIQLSEAPWFGSVTVNYSTHNSSAIAGSDYTATSGSVTFYAWQTSKTVEVPIINDTIHENIETLYMSISNSDSGYIVSDDRGDGTIYDDDAEPLSLTLHNRAEMEQDSNWVLNFTARLNQSAPAGGVTIGYETQDNTALAGSDYIATSGTITIPEGSIDGFIPVTIIGDDQPENSENFNVKITSISQGILNNSEAPGTIYDDDAIEVNIDSSNVDEGNIGDSNKMRFSIYLAKNYPLMTPLTIDYTTQDGTAIAGSDYRAKSGSITFNIGDKEKFIDVDIIGDEDIENNEYLDMIISGSSYIVNNSSRSYILNDDGSYPAISLDSSSFSIVEGNSSQSSLDFTFTLDKPAVDGSSFHYETWDDTAEDESKDNDYIYTHGDKTLTVGTTKVTISVPINGDTKIEDDESFNFKFSDLNRLNYGTTNEAKGIIVNDDGSYPTISFTSSSYSINEGDSGQKDINFTLSLDKPAFKNSHFDYYTTNGTATDTEDYVKVDRTTFNIPEGEQNITIPVKINGDETIEDDESFYLVIDNESENLKVTGTQKPIATILNDDGSYPQISFAQSSYSIIEGDSGEKELNITLTLDAPAFADTHIDYYTEDNKAQDGSTSTEDNDYIATSGTLDIDENSSTASIIVKINGDTNIEPDDNFYLYIHNPKNLIITSNRTEIIIENDDVHNEEPFVCDEHMYLSSSIKRGSEVTGKMWLHRINTTKSPFGFEVMDDAGEEKLYNALAYNEIDNYIYGLYYKELFKISKTGKVMSLGEVNQLPDFLANKQAYAGASYNGYYFVTGFGVNYDKIYKIKLADSDENRTVEDINLSTAVSIKDFSFSPDGKYLYGIADGGKLTKIDINSGEVTFIGDAHTDYEFDSSFSDKNGRFFANDSKGNGFFEFDLANGTKRFLSNSQPADYNDGANCIDAELVFTDYGDAPISYGPAWHNISNGIYLGDKIDHDLNSYDTVDADGDDINGVDDDDGVTLPDGTDINGTNFETNATHSIKVKLSKEAYLKIWIDIDINGHFDNATNLIYNSGGKLSAGEHTISFSLPANLTENTKTYLRARVSSNPSMNPTGFVIDGEVEDYMIKFGKKDDGIKGRFNIQRTNTPKDSKDFRLYTQIVGRDFDYHIVFYDENITKEKDLEKVPLKIDIKDMDTNEILYTTYRYYSILRSRVPVLDNNDLDHIKASKRALFTISYAISPNGSILQKDCSDNMSIRECYDTLNTGNLNRRDKAKDIFAIRPETFFVTIYDGNKERKNSRDTKETKLASGYDYNLTVVATKYMIRDASDGYNRVVNRLLEFNSSNSCADQIDYTDDMIFNNGVYNTPNFKNPNVGKYILKIKDENWTAVDQVTGDCDSNSSDTSSNPNEISGCNITTKIDDVNISFFPDHFNVNLPLNNLPNSTHNDFIYMSDLNSTYNGVAIQLIGDIIAQNGDNQPTSNFTRGCFAQDLDMRIDAQTVSENGINQPLKTKSNSSVYLTRFIKYNNDANISNLDINKTITNIADDFNISKDKFLDENNGTLPIEMRYNINKNISEPINPIQITFTSFDVNGTHSFSTSHNKIDITANNYIPNGSMNLHNAVRNFYFAKVTPDSFNYPRVYITISPIIRTPLSVDIFCDVNNSYCDNLGVINNSILTGTTREQNGWYISAKHNGNIDGNVTELIDNPTGTVTLTPDPTPTNPMSLPNGHNGMESARFNNCNNKKVEVTIVTDPVLDYQPNKYILNCTDNNASQWTGIGKTGNILNVKPKVNRTGKIDW
jgi:hypothetical protein